jgi:hypothetical protein
MIVTTLNPEQSDEASVLDLLKEQSLLHACVLTEAQYPVSGGDDMRYCVFMAFNAEFVAVPGVLSLDYFMRTHFAASRVYNKGSIYIYKLVKTDESNLTVIWNLAGLLFDPQH